mgnify:CR=1 FL=1
MNELMNEHFLDNHLILQVIFLVVLALAVFFIFLIFIRRDSFLKDHDFILLVKGQSDGDYKISCSVKEHITNEEVEAIIEKLLIETGRKNPTIVRLLFTGSCHALKEDDQVGMLFKELTGNELKDQFKK